MITLQITINYELGALTIAAEAMPSELPHCDTEIKTAAAVCNLINALMIKLHEENPASVLEQKDVWKQRDMGEGHCE